MGAPSLRDAASGLGRTPVLGGVNGNGRLQTSRGTNAAPRRTLGGSSRSPTGLSARASLDGPRSKETTPSTARGRLLSARHRAAGARQRARRTAPEEGQSSRHRAPTPGALSRHRTGAGSARQQAVLCSSRHSAISTGTPLQRALIEVPRTRPIRGECQRWSAVVFRDGFHRSRGSPYVEGSRCVEGSRYGSCPSRFVASRDRSFTSWPALRLGRRPAPRCPQCSRGGEGGERLRKATPCRRGPSILFHGPCHPTFATSSSSARGPRA